MWMIVALDGVALDLANQRAARRAVDRQVDDGAGSRDLLEEPFNFPVVQFDRTAVRGRGRR